MEMGKPPMQAAFEGSKEVAFTIVSMTISLAAVFIPVLFMGGLVGRLLREFAVTIGVAILVSGFVSISLTPMLCSRFLKPPHEQTHGWLYNLFERMFDGWLRAYDVTLRFSLRHRFVTLLFSFALFGDYHPTGAAGTGGALKDLPLYDVPVMIAMAMICTLMLIGIEGQR